MSFFLNSLSKSLYRPSSISMQSTRFFSSMLMGSTTSKFASSNIHNKRIVSATNITSVGTTLENSSGSSSVSSLLFNIGSLLGRRWKTRGNTFQPSVIKRKRKLGFLARNSSTRGRKLLERRKKKGRWYLTY